jgi:hypothetical protein
MNGQNFSIDNEMMGFFQTVFVESISPEDAEIKAVEIIKNSDLRDLAEMKAGDSSMIYVDNISEVDSFEYMENVNMGRTFYSEESGE